jgi:serine protease Do
MKLPQALVGLVALAGLASAGSASAQQPFSEVSAEVNRKLVKLFGAGGFRGLNSYGSGILVSPKGHILTVASPLLDTSELIIHLSDGRRFKGRVLVTEPDLDAALVRIDPSAEVEDLPYFDFGQAARAPLAQPGSWVLAFTNAYEVATRNEPLSVQHGVVMAYAKLHGRRGIFEAPFQGDVYVTDAITNNPGAAGGALTTRKGELLGVIGKELKNALTDTYVNYAVPVQAKVTIHAKTGDLQVSLAEFVEKGIRGEYRPPEREKPKSGGATLEATGLVLVPNVVERTPPYVEEVLPNTAAARAGLKPDDLIVYLDGEPVASIKTLKDLLARNRPGTTVRLEVRRGEKLTSIDLKLEEPPVPAAKP